MKILIQNGSAAQVARNISRILGKHDFQKADISHHCCWREGYRVYRIGRSSRVHVDYHISGRPQPHDPAAQDRTDARGALRVGLRLQPPEGNLHRVLSPLNFLQGRSADVVDSRERHDQTIFY
jgi:hypothetical protein